MTTPTDPLAQEARDTITLVDTIARKLRDSDKQWWLFFDGIDSVLTVKQGEVDELIHALIDLADDVQMPLRIVLAGRAAQEFADEHTDGWAERDSAARPHPRRCRRLAATAGPRGEPRDRGGKARRKAVRAVPAWAAAGATQARAHASRCSPGGVDAMIDRDGALALLKEAERGEELAHSEMVERLAVLATFDPQRLDGPDAHDVVHLLCETLPSHEAILCERQRIDALVGMLQRGGHAELARIRRSVEAHTDSPLQRMLDAFVLGDGPSLDERDEDELLASLTVWQWVTEAVAHAGQTLEPIEPGKDAIESRLALLDVTRAIRRLARSGCVGREAELARLHDYRRSRPKSSDLEAEPAMVVYGIGGVGKSTLVARFAMDLYEESDNPDAGVWAYLDLDRPTLASCNAADIMADIIRQVAAQRPDERRKLVRSEEVTRRRIKGAGLEAFDSAWSYRETASEFITAMRGIADGALVVVLDTYEQLERNQPGQARELWDLFALMAAELPRFRLIVSGRTPAMAFVEASRPDRQLHVVGLKDDAALELLRHFVRHEAREGEPARGGDRG